MREILFRGKRTDTGEWVCGNYAHTDCFTKWNDYIGQNVPLDWPVDPYTVGQYTGLKDKTGKRIFEGDIVESDEFNPDNDGYGVIGWDDGAFTVSNEYIIGTFHENFYGAEFTVIGNIHDNPDLLEEETP